MKNLDFDSMRQRMVSEQLVGRGIADPGVLEAFRRVPRHKFVRDEFAESAYGDFPLPIGSGQTISQPFMVALMTELAKAGRGDRVLEVGTGSGYQLAILCELACEVYSVERFDELADSSGRVLKGLGYSNFNIKAGDGTLGWREHAPYDAIIVTAGAPKPPQELLNQLRDGGRLIAPIGGELSQLLTLIERSKDEFKSSQICGCVFVPLVGKDGWPPRTGAV